LTPLEPTLNPISRSTEYAIRALTYLAQQQADGRYHLARTMAEKLGIPAPFLGKILLGGVTREILESQRGRNGGFRLCIPPEQVTLFMISESQETNTGGRSCLLGQAECSDERACPMHEYWKVAAANFEVQMGSTTLTDLMRFCEEKPQSGYPCGTPLGGGSTEPSTSAD
jgi:Rrf2 family iron-sulfur cluster assembly transcriptional regulator